MSRTRISAALREAVRQRAGAICEYCLLHETDGVHAFHVDHVISEKHDGPTAEHNLAFCCPFCNRAKGSDIAGLVGEELVRLFNPRIDVWAEHFRMEAESVVPRSDVGEATVRILGLNDPHRLVLRKELISARLFPSAAARRLIVQCD